MNLSQMADFHIFCGSPFNPSVSLQFMINNSNLPLFLDERQIGMKALRCFSKNPVLLMTIFAHGTWSTKLVKVSSHDNLIVRVWYCLYS
jgi:hypothetical protein